MMQEDLASLVGVALAADDPADVERQLGAFENAIDPRTGDSLLGLAASAGAQRVVSRLLELGVSPSAGGADSPLHAAILADKESMVELLIAAGASPDEADADGDSALALACSLGRWRIGELLVGSGARALPVDAAQKAVLEAPPSLARRLVQVSVPKGDAHAAAELLRLLVMARNSDLGVDPARDRFVAEVEGDLEKSLAGRRRWARIEALAKKGAKLDLRVALERLDPAERRTARTAAIVAAIASARWDVYQEFFPEGVDINAVASNGRTLLMAAAMESRPQLCLTLLRMGASLDQRELEEPYESAREMMEKRRLGRVVDAFGLEAVDG